MATPPNVVYYKPPVLQELATPPKSAQSPVSYVDMSLQTPKAGSDQQTPKSAISETPGQVTPVMRRQFKVYEEESPEKEIDPFHPSTPAAEDVIIKGKNYGTPAVIKERLLELQRYLQMITPIVTKQPTAKQADFVDEDFNMEIESVHQSLRQLMDIPDSLLLKLSTEQRASLGYLMQLFMTNLTLVEENSEYEALYAALEARFREPAFTEFFPAKKV